MMLVRLKYINKREDGPVGFSRPTIRSRHVWAVHTQMVTSIFILILALIPTSSFANALINERSFQYDSLIIKYAREAKIPVALVYSIIRQESAFQPKIGSKTRFGSCAPRDSNPATCGGAYGLMQLMPATGKRFGVAPKDRGVPAKNIIGGTKYLSWLLKRYKGNVRKAVAAYNAGEGAVDKYKGVPPYRETSRYVKKVMGYYRLYAGLSEYQKTPHTFKKTPHKVSKKAVLRQASHSSHKNKTVMVVYNKKRIRMSLQKAEQLKRSLKAKLKKQVIAQLAENKRQQANKRRNLAIKTAQIKKQQRLKLAKTRSIQLAKAQQVKPRVIKPRIRKPAPKRVIAKVVQKQPIRVRGRVSTYHSSSRVRSMTLAMNDGYSRVRARVVR